MDKITRQILQLRNELERQKAEQVKLLEESQNLTREAQQEIKLLHAQRKENEVVVAPPQPPTAPASQSGSVVQGGRFFGYGDRTPPTEELLKIWDTAQEVELFEELQNWIDHDRAAQATPTHSDSKWFGGDRPQPSIEDMMNPKNFGEMLAELEQR